MYNGYETSTAGNFEREVGDDLVLAVSPLALQHHVTVDGSSIKFRSYLHNLHLVPSAPAFGV